MWEVVENGDNDLDAIEAAIQNWLNITDKPFLVKLATTIGVDSVLRGTSGVHGNPLLVTFRAKNHEFK